eukprot:761454-Pyramimonas_sp.AAC.1
MARAQLRANKLNMRVVGNVAVDAAGTVINLAADVAVVVVAFVVVGGAVVVEASCAKIIMIHPPTRGAMH